MDPIYSVKQILEANLVPVGKRQLMKLIALGEESKKGTLAQGMNYIIAINVGNGPKRARWAVTKTELDAWAERARNTSKNGLGKAM